MKLRLIMLLLIVTLSVNINSEELTKIEAVNYVNNIGVEQLAYDIMKLDRIENAIPVIVFPQEYFVVKKNGDIYIVREVGKIKIDIADLSYTVEIPENEKIGHIDKSKDKTHVYITVSVFTGCTAFIAATGGMFDIENVKKAAVYGLISGVGTYLALWLL